MPLTLFDYVFVWFTLKFIKHKQKFNHPNSSQLVTDENILSTLAFTVMKRHQQTKIDKRLL